MSELLSSYQTNVIPSVYRRNSEQQHTTLSLLKPYFQTVWQTRQEEGVKPTLLPFITSGNNLPIQMSLRDTSFCYVIGLYEQMHNSGVAPVAFLAASDVLYPTLLCATGEYLSGIYTPIFSHEGSDPYLSTLLTLNDNNGIFVQQEHRGYGLSTILLNAAMLLAIQTKSQDIFFDRVNDTSLAIIKHLGFPIKHEQSLPRSSITISTVNLH